MYLFYAYRVFAVLYQDVVANVLRLENCTSGTAKLARTVGSRMVSDQSNSHILMFIIGLIILI